MADAQLAKGTILKGADSGKTIVVGEYIGGGGQGDVYKVTYDGQQKALKWYRNPALVPKNLYDILCSNARNGSPGNAFMWPIETTEYHEVTLQTKDGARNVETYGYVMDLIPSGYYSFGEFLLTNKRFSSYRVAIDACLEISKVFRVLHSKGLCYQDLNAGNFFFKPATGDVVICDCDNVTKHGVSTGIIGTPGFMAPELVKDDWEYVHNKDDYRNEYRQTHRRRVQPDYKTDRFSMAVLIFEILTLTNPLCGKRALRPQDYNLKVRLYGYNALFMFDPDSNENEPHPDVHGNAIAVWNALPSYMKELFQRAFSQEALKNANARMNEGEWLKSLVRMRADIFTCPACGARGELFTDSASKTKCGACGRRVKPPLVFVFEDGVRIPAVPGTRVYRLLVGPTPIGKELEPVAGVVVTPSNPSNWKRWGIRNVSDQPFDASIRGGQSRTFAPGQVVPVGPDLVIRVYDKNIKVDLNNE